MTQQTDPQEVLARLAQRVPELREYWAKQCENPDCSCHDDWAPLPLLEAVDYLVKHPLFWELTRGELYSCQFGHCKVFDPDWRTAVLLAGEKALATP